jgi:predicted ATPase
MLLHRLYGNHEIPSGAGRQWGGRHMRTIEKIEIKGFKSIESAELELGDLNVLIGANGSGKSNLIGTFNLLERHVSNRLDELVAGEPDRFVFHGSKTTPEMSLTLTSKGQEYYLPLKAVRDKLVQPNRQSRTSVKSPPRSAVVGRRTSDAPHPVNRSSPSTKKTLHDLVRDFIVYHFDDASDQSPAKKIAHLDDIRSFRHDASNLAPFLYWMQEKEPVRFRRIEEYIRLAAPFFERFDLAPHERWEDKIKLNWRQKGSDAHFDAFSLSDGTLRFICLVTLLLQPKPPGLILLDEPELGLHPFAINMLAGMLESASKRAQVIVATQSVTLLDNFGTDRVVVAKNDGRRSTFARLDQDKLATWLEDYSLGELWEKNVLGGRP